jgi:hypothetical protein
MFVREKSQGFRANARRYSGSFFILLLSLAFEILAGWQTVSEIPGFDYSSPGKITCTKETGRSPQFPWRLGIV